LTGRRAARRAGIAIALASALLAPEASSADRGALTLEAGPSLALLPRVASPLPLAAGVSVAAPAALLGLRYAPGNHLELSATGVYQFPESATTSLLSPEGVVVASLAETVSGFGALLGARYLGGLGWRFQVGAELGFWHSSFTGCRVTGGAAGPGPVASFARDAFTASAAGGLEWQVSDRVVLDLTPRLGLLAGRVPGLLVLVPVSIGFSWYLL